MRALISFFFLIIIVSNVETASAETGLLHWTRADRAIPWRQTSVNASKPWKLCALYPSLKDSYWLSVNYGMQKAAKLYGVDLKVLEANGYRQLATQQQQMMQCREWGADAILLGSSTDRFPELERYAGNVPVIELVNMIHDASVATRVGLPWFQMGYLPGRFLVQWSKGKALNVLLFPGPEEAGGSQEMVAGFRQAIKGSAINIVDIAWGDNDIVTPGNAGAPSGRQCGRRVGDSGGGGDGRRAKFDDSAHDRLILSDASGLSRFKTRPYPDGAQRSDGLAGRISDNAVD